MRAPFLLLATAFTTLASMPALAQEAPRVIFCAGECFAVDAAGIRTPAPKGTTLGEGQRLETGAGAYAQLKLGQDTALGVGERAQVRFDQRSVRDRDLVMLDQGRIRMVSGEAIGKATPRALELRTQDGTFALRGADVEVRRTPATTGAGSGLTVVKVNAGDARLLNPQGGIAISKDGVQGIAAGNVVTDKSISVADVALTLSRPGVAAATPTALLPEPIRNLNLPAPTLPLPGPIVRPDIFGPVVPLPGIPLAGPNPRMVPLPPLIGGDKILGTPVGIVNPQTGKTETLGTALAEAICICGRAAISAGSVATPAATTPLIGTTITLSSAVAPQTTTPVSSLTSLPTSTPAIALTSSAMIKPVITVPILH